MWPFKKKPYNVKNYYVQLTCLSCRHIWHHVALIDQTIDDVLSVAKCPYCKCKNEPCQPVDMSFYKGKLGKPYQPTLLDSYMSKCKNIHSRFAEHLKSSTPPHGES